VLRPDSDVGGVVGLEDESGLGTMRRRDDQWTPLVSDRGRGTGETERRAGWAVCGAELVGCAEGNGPTALLGCAQAQAGCSAAALGG
jgi:hypothetical protein